MTFILMNKILICTWLVWFVCWCHWCTLYYRYWWVTNKFYFSLVSCWCH